MIFSGARSRSSSSSLLISGIAGAAAVAVAGDRAQANVTDQLANLVAKSLVVADTRGDASYYRLLESTRAYALEKLDGGGEYRNTARRQAESPRSARRLRAADKERNMAGKTSSEQKPNILVIWGDDIGIANLSCYNHGVMGYRTPSCSPRRRS